MCAVTIAEVAVLLAQQFPSPFSDHIITYFFPKRSPSSLRLTPISALACALGISGGLIRVWCHRELGRFFTWEVAVRDDHQLITSGPYSIVRHPSYTGWLLLVSGNFLLLHSGGSAFVETGMRNTILGKIVAVGITAHLTWITAGLLYRTKTEDAMLRNQFKTEWTEWAKRTPYRVLPLVY